MASEKNQNIQDVFLNTLRKEKVPVTVFLTSGVNVAGRVPALADRRISSSSQYAAPDWTQLAQRDRAPRSREIRVVRLSCKCARKRHRVRASCR